MKYVVLNSRNYDLICCDNLASAEELILSIAEEEAFTECNYTINILEYTDTLEECMNMLRNWWKKYHWSNECIALYLGGIDYDIRVIPSLED